jgi:hypothetical protein
LALFQGHNDKAAEVTGEIESLERQVNSPAVRAELRAVETRLEELRAEWATIRTASALPGPECIRHGS